VGKMISYALLVLWDILVANIEVAWIVLTVSNDKLKPAWITIPLDLRQPEAITLLAGTITLIVGLCQIMAMIRLVIGPGTGDRILALDTMVVNAIGLIVLMGLAQGIRIYFEASLIIAMLGFVSTVAYARFVLRGDIIE